MVDHPEGRMAGRPGPPGLDVRTAIGLQLIYSAGLSAVTTVWVAAKFTEEHRAALDRLSEISLVRALDPTDWSAAELHEPDTDLGAGDAS